VKGSSVVMGYLYIYSPFRLLVLDLPPSTPFLAIGKLSFPALAVCCLKRVKSHLLLFYRVQLLFFSRFFQNDSVNFIIPKRVPASRCVSVFSGIRRGQTPLFSIQQNRRNFPEFKHFRRCIGFFLLSLPFRRHVGTLS